MRATSGPLHKTRVWAAPACEAATASPNAMVPAVKASKQVVRSGALLIAAPVAMKRRVSKEKRGVDAAVEETPATTPNYRSVDGVGYDVFDSPTGPVTLIASFGGLHEIFLGAAPESAGGRRTPPVVDSLRRVPHDPIICQAREQLQEYFRSERTEFTVPLAPLMGTKFQRAAWAALARIPYGSVISYGEQARNMGLLAASARAVGAANGRNPLPIIVPCHRVVGKSGSLTGFASGLDKKETLLRLEAKAIGATALTWISLHAEGRDGLRLNGHKQISVSVNR